LTHELIRDLADEIFLKRLNMRSKLIAMGAILALAIPTVAYAQSNVPGGATAGAIGGLIVGGPVGAVVGGVAGAVVGGIADENRPQFREYVVTQRRPSYAYKGDVRVGVELPSSGVTYYEAPAEYGVRNYRYTRVNDRIVLVDPSTHRVVQIIE
jgi:hypothetical protein